MSENNLPIKLVLPKISDIVPNTGGGKIKFFGEVTPDLQRMVSDKFESLLSFYSDVFDENETIPAVGKITVKPEAIAKSHKPTDLCRNCPIIGSEDLDEIYIKVNRKNIQETIGMVKNPPSQKFQANGKIAYKGQVPLESKWDEKFEAARVEHGFKWSPIKSYYRKLSRGINLEDGWKLRIDLTPRDGLYVPSQEFVLIITIKDSNGNDIYSEITNGLRDKGYATNNIETKYQIRQRQ